MHHVGLTDMTYESVTPLALVDIVPSSVLVKSDSQFETLDQLLDFVKANPGELTGSGTAQGGIWHLALAGMLNAEGLAPDAIRWIPSQGAAPALQELIAGGVDVASPALSEGKALVESGELRALAYMHTERMGALPDVPTTAELLDSGWTLAAWITASGPAGMPEEIACSYEAAIAEAFAKPEWAEFKASRGSEVVGMSRADLTAFMEQSDAALGDVISAVGLGTN
jgi:tripartite-type tricarboxylate transporter receptor subunit TctC